MENKTEKRESRRKFIKGAGKAVVIAPAAGLILNASKASAEVCTRAASGRDCEI